MLPLICFLVLMLTEISITENITLTQWTRWACDMRACTAVRTRRCQGPKDKCGDEMVTLTQQVDLGECTPESKCPLDCPADRYGIDCLPCSYKCDSCYLLNGSCVRCAPEIPQKFFPSCYQPTVTLAGADPPWWITAIIVLAIAIPVLVGAYICHKFLNSDD